MQENELLQYTVTALRDAEINYLVTGSMASMYYGEARMTRDMDILVWLTSGDDRLPFLLKRFSQPEFYLSPDAAAQAISVGGQFNVLHVPSSFKIDFMVAQNSLYDRTRLNRPHIGDLPGARDVQIAAPEDVMLKKMQHYKQGGSEKHLRDITGIMKISGELVDIAYVEHWADELDVREVWDAICRRLGR